MPKFTVSIEKVDLEDREAIGRKFANFSFLKHNPLVKSPSGFFVTAEGFHETLSTHLTDLKDLLSSNFTSKEIVENSKKILYSKLKLSPELKTEIVQRTKSLKKPLLVVGNLIYQSKEFETEAFTTVANSEKGLFEAVINAYLSFLQLDFTKKLINNDDLEDLAVVLMISEKVLPEISGSGSVDFLDKNKIRIRSGWGEYHKDFAKDISVVNKNDLSEVSYFISQQKQQIAYIKDSYKSLEISEGFQTQRKLSLDSAQTITQVLRQLENQALSGVSLDFAISKSKIYITKIELNSTPGQIFKEAASSIINLPLLGSLKPIFPGIVTGSSKLLTNKRDFPKLRTGEIAIVNSIESESLPFLRRASGIIINSNQNLKSAQKALVKKLGISTAIGKFTSSKSSVITLDSRSGNVYQGAFSPRKPNLMEPSKRSEEPAAVKTATKLFATLPYSNSRINLDLAASDGIGPLHLENFSIKTKQEAFNFLTQVCQRADGKPVILELSQNHPNPDEYMIAQGHLVKEIRNKASFKNLTIALTSQKTVSNLVTSKKLLSAIGLHRSPTLKIFLKIETAANIFSLKDLIETGIDGLIIDYWSLVNNLYQEDLTYSDLSAFDDAALYTALENIIETAKKSRQFSLVYNFPIESAPRLSSRLVSFSVKALATSWQDVSTLRSAVAQAERNLIGSKK